MGSCVAVDRLLGPEAQHGRERIEHWMERAPGLEVLVRLLTGSPLSSGDPDRTPPLFVDLETTGLAGGAGTHAFLIGCGWFGADGFETRQYFLTGFETEPELLAAAAEHLGSAAALVTYNGKSFDLPVLETRFLFQRMTMPFAETPHVDMLHPARRMWQGDESCALSALERELFDKFRVGDVPGYEIPARYFQYVRTGQASVLEPVLEHNRLDLVSLAGLAVRAGWLIEQGPEAARDPRECYGLGRLLERAGRHDEAQICYERAARDADDHDPFVLVNALLRVALRLGRDRRHAEAADIWSRVLAVADRSPSAERLALHALAVHHEHRSKDLSAAKDFTIQALERGVTRNRIDAARYRLARLDRKIGRGSLLDRV